MSAAALLDDSLITTRITTMNDSMDVSGVSVLDMRDGTVLCRSTMLKADHFPGCQSKRLSPQIPGAPNFRSVPNLPIYGVGAPTLGGARNVLSQIRDMHGKSTNVLWHNMREEPVLYVHGRPYVVREASKPFANVEYRGIAASRLEAMERQLRRDVLAEAARYGGRIMVTEETDDMQVVSVWRDVDASVVFTPLEMYEHHLAAEFQVDYLRVPLTDEKAPTAAACDILVDRLASSWREGGGIAVVFNCQMGRGRTTTGMAIATIVLASATPSLLPSPEPPIAASPSSLSASPPDGSVQVGTDVLNGMYPVVRSLVRALEHGHHAKDLLDRVLDECGKFQNLRDAIQTMRDDLQNEHDDRRKSENLSRCADYLERYAVLLLFSSYVLAECGERQQSIPATASPPPSFTDWWKSRPELQSVLNRLLRRDPLAALLLHKGPSAPLSKTSTQEAMDVVAERKGGVLGQFTIIKEDHFPNCQYTELEPRFYPQAPNFRQADTKPVYGVAIPTAQGVRDVLAAAGCYCGDGAHPCNWHNLREEAVVYLKGSPYVLREAHRPYHNIEEYEGIDAQRLEGMEERLRLDILAEARGYGGRLLVSRESVDGSLYDTWLELDDADIQTPKHVFDQLVAKGVPVTYARVPMTDGQPPKLRDLDQVTDNVRRSVNESGVFPALVFSCQLGRGRTTTGMIVGCLLHNRLSAALGDGGGGGGRSESLTKSHSLLEDAATSSPRPSTEDGDFSFDATIGAGMRRNASRDSLASSLTSDDDYLLGGGSACSSPDMFTHKSRRAWNRRNRWYPLEMGFYAPVRWLCQVLDSGEVVKAGVDAVTDLCGALLNVRTAPLFESGLVRAVQGPHAKMSSGYTTNEESAMPQDEEEYRRDRIRRTSNLQRGAQLLQRYYLLVAYAWWLECRMDMPEESPHAIEAIGDGGERHLPGEKSFEDWMSTRPEVLAMRNSIFSNPALALAPPVPVSEQVRGLEGLLDGEEARPEGIDAWAGPAEGDASLPSVPPREQVSVLRSRKGSVLGRRTILKLYHFPGVEQQGVASSGDLPPLIGVPNACVIPATMGRRTRIVAAAVPTREGMSNLVRVLETRRTGAAIVLADLREDAVVYLNGNPYVLRDLDRPQSELGYAGMSPDSLVKLETRLMDDVLTEARTRQDRILVHAEAPSALGKGGLLKGPAGIGANASDSTHIMGASTPGHEVRAYYATLQNAETPEAFFSSFGATGVALQYQRVPLSRARRPAVADVDRIHEAVRSGMGAEASAEDRTVLFVSHTGLGTSVRFACIAAVLALSSSTELMASDPADGAASEDDAELPAIRTVARALPHGSACLRAVNRVMSELAPLIGDLRQDIAECQRTAKAGGWPKTPSRKAAEAAALGLNYIKRVFHLVTFASFLCESSLKADAGALRYSEWFAKRDELSTFEANFSIL
ncbi:hypothetical protein PPROV_000325400 [Pycnococcus provasolii]|uniref:Tyrosine specific protein phosphatases domain-containing protein n=2 Tax=Pycnococcus provasolii TaxID=41880 RepID=A0A830HFC0_9CHLO|nr:hypothetical protein PPROV_000325400 [Pycnococcus provasolii]